MSRIKHRRNEKSQQSQDVRVKKGVRIYIYSSVICDDEFISHYFWLIFILLDCYIRRSFHFYLFCDISALFIPVFLQLGMTETIGYLRREWKQTAIPRMKQCTKLIISLKCHKAFGNDYIGR